MSFQWVSGDERSRRRAALLGLCLVFAAVRLLVAWSSVDRLHNVDRSEYQLAEYAHNLLQGKGNEYPELTHLWGHSAFAAFLIPFVLATGNDTVALKYAATAIATLGFAALTALMWRIGGGGAALVFALLMIFPDRNFLKWNLMYWGAHPESVFLVGAGAWAWVRGIDPENPRRATWTAAAGLLCAVAIYASASVFFVVLVLWGLTAVVVTGRRRVSTLAVLMGSFLVGLAPLLVKLGGGLVRSVFEPAVFDNTRSLAMSDAVGPPSVERLREFVEQGWARRFYDTPALGIAAAVASLLVLFGLPRMEDRTRAWAARLFPIATLLAIVVISMFRYPQHLHTRHVLWFYVSGYACLALVLGRPWGGGADALSRSFRWDAALRYGLVAIAVVLQFAGMSRLIRLSDLGMLGRFEGTEYSRYFLGRVVGPEVERLNGLLKAYPMPRPKDSAFVRGMGAVFKMDGEYDCCLWKPDPPSTQYADPPDDATDRNYYFMGMGCAASLKDGGSRMLLDLFQRFGFDASNAATYGFERCSPFRLPRPD